MNTAITDTNIILNIAVSPSLWLLSNHLILLKNPVPGFNNRLKIANTSVSFGYNRINREPIDKLPKSTAKLLTKQKKELTAMLLHGMYKIRTLKDDTYVNNLTIIFGGTLAAGYIVSKYVL